MSTYSINVGTVTESSSLNSLNDILNQLPDNADNLISPKDVRDGIYTSWTNNVFKPTTVTASVIEYIGLDSSETGFTLKEKFLIGKRNLLGYDVMNNNLLLSDTDIFLFNSKVDTGSQSTKISILSGTDSSLYSTAPYIISEYIVGTNSTYIDLGLVNKSGFIKLSSDKGVILNDLIFPSTASSASASNGYVLKYFTDGSKKYVNWEPIGTANIDTIIGNTVSITGNTILVNGSEIEFTNAKPVLIPIGGIDIGETFSNSSIVSVLDELIYPYVSATLSISLNGTASPSNSLTQSDNGLVVEYSSLSSITYNYNIIEKTYPLTSILTSPGGTLPPTLVRLSGTSSISVATSSQTYTIQVTDGTASVSASASLTYVYPYFWGVTSSVLSFTSSNILSNLNKVIKTKSDTSLNLIGDESHIYFLYPSSYGSLSSIIDPVTGWNFISSFTEIYSAIALTSSSPTWSSTYSVYSYTAGSGITTVNGIWTFKH